MPDDFCTVSFSGSHGGTYYTPCDTVRFLSSSDLTNSSSATIYLYDRKGSDRVSIRCDPVNYPYFSRSYSSYEYITDAHDITFNSLAYYYRSINYIELFVMSAVFLYILMRLTGVKK